MCCRYELISEALNLLNNVYGAMHPEIAACCRLLARLNYIMGDYCEAMSYAQRAVLMSERVLGIDHPSTITEYVSARQHSLFISVVGWFREDHLQTPNTNAASRIAFEWEHEEREQGQHTKTGLCATGTNADAICFVYSTKVHVIRRCSLAWTVCCADIRVLWLAKLEPNWH